MSWNTTEYGGVDSVVIQPRNLWIPDILLYNRCIHQYLLINCVFNYWESPEYLKKCMTCVVCTSVPVLYTH